MSAMQTTRTDVISGKPDRYIHMDVGLSLKWG